MERPDCIPDLNAPPKSANDEAFIKIHGALVAASKEYERLGFFSFRRKSYYKGVVMTLTLVLNLLHELHHKYDNVHGEFN